MRLLPILLTMTLVLSSCNRGYRPGDGGKTDTTTTKLSAGRFKMENGDGFKKLTIRDPWQNAEGEELIYYLAPVEAVLPESISDDHVIRVPVKRMVCMSVTHLAMLRALDATDIIVGTSGTSLIYDPGMREDVINGRISDVGYEGSLDREMIVSLKPDLLMAYGVGPSSSEYLRKLTEMGVKVMFNADYLEEHPLARCEWIKVFGVLTGKEEMADSICRQVAESYLQLAGKVKRAGGLRPDVLLGSPWQDVWYISPSNSYIGSMISDAGGRYLFDYLAAPNSVPYSVEAVFKMATEADVWLNPGIAGTLDEIAASDHRMAMLPVYKSGNVWNNRNRMTAEGGNDYWESAVVRPDLLLGDFVSILHPELMPGHLPFYYRKLE